ncbi:MAG: hypothetical protein AB1489_31045 [Acidobacteriota bacterium]
MKLIKAMVILTFLGMLFLSLSAERVFGYPPFLKQVQQLGFEAKDCAYCHEKPTGNKGWNKRGLWLKEQKKERKAPIVDVKWLKNYNPEIAEDKDKNKESETK